MSYSSVILTKGQELRIDLCSSRGRAQQRSSCSFTLEQIRNLRDLLGVSPASGTFVENVSRGSIFGSGLTVTLQVNGTAVPGATLVFTADGTERVCVLSVRIVPGISPIWR